MAIVVETTDSPAEAAETRYRAVAIGGLSDYRDPLLLEKIADAPPDEVVVVHSRQSAFGRSAGERRRSKTRTTPYLARPPTSSVAVTT